ncbi:dihydroorotate dehydrogenase [candidate division SR1 bacterium]|nr:dihydroorotate dehydrogenase [candidate division SR1 bacterium]
MIEGSLTVGNMTWTHLVNPHRKQVDPIIEKYQLHEIIEQDFLDFTTQDKIDVYDDCIFLILRFPKYNEKLKKHFVNTMHAILGKDFIITVTSHVTNNIERIQNKYREELAEDDSEEFKLSPYYVLYKIIDSMYDKALTGLGKFAQDLVKIEEDTFDAENVNQNLLSSLLIKKRNAILLKQIMTPHSEILGELQIATVNFYEGDLDVYFEDLQYKTDKILSIISMVKENTESLFDVSDTLATMKTNRVISILTIFTVILGILTWLSGMYGMNVDLPFDDSPWAFSILFFVMFAAAGFTMFYFRKKRRF